MKKLFSLMLLLATMLSFTACGDDDKDELTVNDILGTWRVSQISTDNGESFRNWTLETTIATFKADGTYYGSGVFGTGFGTWEQKDNTVITYVDGEVYMTYKVIDLATCIVSMESSLGSNGNPVLLKCIKL